MHTNPILVFSRVLISQDRHCIYVTFASCHDDYLNYLNKGDGKGKITPRSFLKMQTYGPWKVNIAEHMKNFAILILAFTLVAHRVA